MWSSGSVRDPPWKKSFLVRMLGQLTTTPSIERHHDFAVCQSHEGKQGELDSMISVVISRFANFVVSLSVKNSFNV